MNWFRGADDKLVQRPKASWSEHTLCLRDTTEIVLSLGAVPSDVADLLALVAFSFTMQGTRSPNDDETVGCEALGMA